MELVLYVVVLCVFQLQLHVVSPILASGVIAGMELPLLSVVIFRETLTLMTEAGVCLIIAWVVLISVSHQ